MHHEENTLFMKNLPKECLIMHYINLHVKILQERIKTILHRARKCSVRPTTNVSLMIGRFGREIFSLISSDSHQVH